MVSVFQNLVSNAIKFHGDDPPRVEIWADSRDGVWQISLRDNGIGIDAEYQDRVFVIFQRLHARSDYPGTGIGLAFGKTNHRSARRKHLVRIEAREGTTFRFTLPKARDV